MKNSLRRLTARLGQFATQVVIAAHVLVAGAHASAQAPAAGRATITPPDTGVELSPGDRLLVEAATRLQRRASITARLRHQTSIDGRQSYGVGGYWQQGMGDDLRVRLELQIAGGQEARASLLQISNGRFLWLDRTLPTGRIVSRIDLRKLRADPVLAAVRLDDIGPGEVNWSPGQSNLAANCSGLPQLVSSLGANFSFQPPQAMRLVAPGESRPASVPYFAVVGHWKPERLAALLTDRESRVESQQPENSPSIPERFPQEVLLLFGQADLFPYRIEYRRRETPAATRPQGPPAYQLSTQPTVVVEFSSVAFDVPITPSQFDYAPPDVGWVDHTAALIERLRREQQEKLAAQAGQTPLTLPVR